MEYNLADLFESAVDAFSDREYLVVDHPDGQQRRTFAEVESRANRLAHHLIARGIGPGDHVGIHGLNCAEWVEAMWAVFKVRAVPININHRYVAAELRYIFDHADLAGLVFQRRFADRVRQARDALTMVKECVLIEDGSDVDADLDGDPFGATEYEAALAGGDPGRDFGPRSGDDRYILYTGGTTGLPKGVLWRHEDQFFAFSGVNPATGRAVSRPEELVDAVRARDRATVVSFAPLMHNNGQWAAIGGALNGSLTVLVSKFDPRRAWELVAEERITAMMLVGDAMAAPLAEALTNGDGRFDTSSLKSISSGGAVLSARVKERLAEALPGVRMFEMIGSTESGPEARTTGRMQRSSDDGVRVMPGANTIVVDDELNLVGPGGVGRIAKSGRLPLEYLKDPERTASTFVTIGGVRHVVPGDYARVEDDGSITFLGRGSTVINTGGEKVFPEEVEAIVKAHPAVRDAVVIGRPDERWGQRVTAVVEPCEGSTITLEDLQEHCRGHLAGYKVPREVCLVAHVERQPTGKPDYRWAQEVCG